MGKINENNKILSYISKILCICPSKGERYCSKQISANIWSGGKIGALSDNGDPLGYNEIVTTKCLTNNIKRRNIGKRFVFENEAKTHPLSFA